MSLQYEPTTTSDAWPQIEGMGRDVQARLRETILSRATPDCWTGLHVFSALLGALLTFETW